jgi:hypothetical protein
MLNDIYQSSSNFLKASDLGDQKPVVEIETAEIKENNYDGQEKKQIVLSFVGKDKVLGLNFTNASKISQLIGTEDFNEWVGYRIRLYKDQTKFEGRIVDCIRVFPDLPEQVNEKAKAATASTGNDDSDIPF